MALPVWGNLEKSQIDPETIEEAIARLIQAHEDDANAHVEAGESLQSHKASEIIDHIIASVVADKIKEGEIDLYHLTAKKRLLFTSFESLDGWGTFGNIILDLGNCAIWTGAVNGNIAEIDAAPSNWTGFDITKEFDWQATVKIENMSNQRTYFGPTGHPDIGGLDGVGFSNINGTDRVFTYVGGVFNTTPISDFSADAWNVYRIQHRLDPERYLFFVNGVLKATITTDLPGDSADFAAMFYIKTNEAAVKKLYVSDFLFSVDK